MNWQISFSLWILINEEIHIIEYVQLAREEIVDAKYNMDERVDLAWGREIH